MSCSYDLTKSTINREYSVLTWLMPGECAGTPYVFSSIACYPSKRLLLLANRNEVLVCEVSTGQPTADLSSARVDRILNKELSPLERIVS